MVIAFQTGLKKKKEYSRFYTKQELDAINYFHGNKFYAKQQNQNVKPNIFDTRQSFLKKMHDPVMRKNFLNTFNSKNNSLERFLEDF